MRHCWGERHGGDEATLHIGSIPLVAGFYQIHHYSHTFIFQVLHE
jgi:hypothetical protein